MECGQHALHLLARQIEQNGIGSVALDIPRPTLVALIERYTREAGVRNLEREISSCLRKIARKFVGAGDKETVTEIVDAEKVRELCGSTSELSFQSLPVDDPKVRQPDITRAKAILGWEPRVDLDEGLRRTLPYFQARV